MIVLEVFVLIISGYIYGRRESIELMYPQEELLNDLGENEFYLDRSSEGNYIATPSFTLPKGLYKLEVQYEYEGEAQLKVVHPGGQYNSEISGEIPLSEKNEVSCDFRIKDADRQIQVRGIFPDPAQEGEYLLLRNIHITYADNAVRNFVFRMAVFLFIFDGLLYLVLSGRRERRVISATYKALAVLVAFSSIPLMVDYLFLNSHDLYFHLMRIEGLKAGLEGGMFPVRIQPGWLSGHGYASSVFYGDMFLYFPAILRYFGVSVQAAYKCYVVFINLLTVGIAYHCFTKMSNQRIGLVCAAVYSLNLYRLTCIYTRAAVGEYTAMAFIPLVLYGLWKLYTFQEETREHKESWITITAGCTGIFLSHMITTEITALFVILSAMILWKKIMRKGTLLVVMKAVIATVLLNAWFLVPFSDYMLNGTYVINNADKYTPYQIEKSGISVAQLFMTEYTVFGHSSAVFDGSAAEMPLTVGITMLLVLVGWFFLCMFRKEGSAEERRKETFTALMCLLSLFMATYLFPYTRLAEWLPFIRLPIVSIQFLWRILSIAAVMLTCLLCLILQKEWIALNKRRIFAGILVGISFWQGIMYMSQCLQSAEVYRVYQGGNLSTMVAHNASKEIQPSVLGGEYLPLNWSEGYVLAEYVSKYEDKLTYDSNCVNVEEWEHGRNTVAFSVRNMTGEVQQVEVPLLLYKGYKALTQEGETLQVVPGTSYRISVSIPAGFSGEINVKFYEPWYWKIGDVLSLLTLIAILHVLHKANTFAKHDNFADFFQFFRKMHGKIVIIRQKI